MTDTELNERLMLALGYARDLNYYDSVRWSKGGFYFSTRDFCGDDAEALRLLMEARMSALCTSGIVLDRRAIAEAALAVLETEE